MKKNIKTAKSISDLKFSKNVISKFAQKSITGGRFIDAGDTYTCLDSPMTSCNNKCLDDTVTSAAKGCHDDNGFTKP